MGGWTGLQEEEHADASRPTLESIRKRSIQRPKQEPREYCIISGQPGLLETSCRSAAGTESRKPGSDCRGLRIQRTVSITTHDAHERFLAIISLSPSSSSHHIHQLSSAFALRYHGVYFCVSSFRNWVVGGLGLLFGAGQGGTKREGRGMLLLLSEHFAFLEGFPALFFYPC